MVALILAPGCGKSITTSSDSDDGQGSSTRAQNQTMRVFWNADGNGIESQSAIGLKLAEAKAVWSDDLTGIKGDFIGLIDDNGRTIQFYFDEDAPLRSDDASSRAIIRLDFPVVEKGGSCGMHVAVRDVEGLIEKAFVVGADYRQYDGVSFESW